MCAAVSSIGKRNLSANGARQRSVNKHGGAWNFFHGTAHTLAERPAVEHVERGVQQQVGQRDGHAEGRAALEARELGHRFTHRRTPVRVRLDGAHDALLRELARRDAVGERATREEEPVNGEPP